MIARKLGADEAVFIPFDGLQKMVNIIGEGALMTAAYFCDNMTIVRRSKYPTIVLLDQKMLKPDEI
jgi:hypothetical protein